MKTLVALLIACGAFAAAQARPLYIQESARISNPDPTYESFAADVALDGDEAFLTLRHFEPNVEEDPFDDESHTLVYLFHRVGGIWTPVRSVAEGTNFVNIWPNGLVMKSGIAAFALNPLQIFEKRNGDWMQATVTGIETDMPGDSVSIDQQKVLYGGSSGPFQGALYEKDAAGTWNMTARMVGEFRGGDDEFRGRDVGISGIHAVVMSPFSDDGPIDPTPNVTVFRDWGVGSGWLREFTIANSLETPFGEHVDIHNDEIVINGNNKTGSFLFRPNNTLSWALAGRLQPLGSYMQGGETSVIHMSDRFVMQQSFNYDRDASVINVFTRDANGVYAHSATLVSSDGSSIGRFAISGNRVMAACGGEACVFDLPASLTQRAVIQDRFTGTTPTNWTLSAGSQFAVVQSGPSRVLRQSETASTATHTAVLTASNWTNESIQSDVRPTAFNGTDRWVGLATRYRDAGNYYYVTLRASNRVLLRKLVNGAPATIASAALPVALNRTYRLRLESIGTRHRVYADGVLALDADDSSFPSGRAALLTFHAAANFDNVVVSPTPTATLYAAQPNEGFSDMLWTTTGPALWGNASIGTKTVYSQSSVAGDARAVIGVPTDDQQVDFLVRPTTFAGTGTGDRWFGAIARYTDDSNYYYVSLRSGGSISLRRLTSGGVSVLATASMPVTIGTWYRLRLEAVGSRLRAYVNGTLVLEAIDTTHARGMTGMITYRAAAQFDQFRAIQP